MFKDLDFQQKNKKDILIVCKKYIFLFVGFLVLQMTLHVSPSLAHYCDDHYTEQKARENCWWRYWNNRPSQEDLQYQAQPTPVPPPVQPVKPSKPDNNERQTASTAPTSNHYCDTQYTRQKARENCWWRYWNNQPSVQDEQYISLSQNEVVDRPAGENVMTVSVGTDTNSEPTVTLNQNQYNARGHHRNREDQVQTQVWTSDLNQAIEDGTTVVINYPEDPSDPASWANYRRAEDETYDQGEPYTVCFPATTTTRRNAEGVEVTYTQPEECVKITPS